MLTCSIPTVLPSRYRVLLSALRTHHLHPSESATAGPYATNIHQLHKAKPIAERPRPGGLVHRTVYPVFAALQSLPHSLLRRRETEQTFFSELNRYAVNIFERASPLVWREAP